jgi:prevent-host-death family protein
MNINAKITTMTSREFNQDTAKAKRAARQGPVFITDRGRPSHVLLSKEEFDRLEGRAREPERKFVSAAEALAHPESAHLDFDVPEFKGSWGLRVPDLED